VLVVGTIGLEHDPPFRTQGRNRAHFLNPHAGHAKNFEIPVQIFAAFAKNISTALDNGNKREWLTLAEAKKSPNDGWNMKRLEYVFNLLSVDGKVKIDTLARACLIVTKKKTPNGICSDDTTHDRRRL
jgi:hypothetical protein